MQTRNYLYQVRRTDLEVESPHLKGCTWSDCKTLSWPISDDEFSILPDIEYSYSLPLLCDEDSDPLQG